MLDVRQLLLLNNLLYAGAFPFSGDADGMAVAALASRLDPAAEATRYTSSAKWRVMLAAIRADPTLAQVHIARAYRDDATGDRGCLFSAPGERIVAFRGTGAGEWRDNFIAGGELAGDELSPQQRRALALVRELGAGEGLLTVTGHSKGGNKAKLCALLDGAVGRCVSFDGQGFSDAFVRRYAARIAARRGRIFNCNVDCDLVSALLNDVGEPRFYAGHPEGGGVFAYHAPSAFFDMDCRMAEGARPAGVAALDCFLNSYLRSMPAGRRADALALAGELAEAATEAGAAGALAALCAPDAADDAAYLLAYALRYERDTGALSGAAAGILDAMGLSALAAVARWLRMWMEDGYAAGLARKVLRLGQGVPAWLGDALGRQLGAPDAGENARCLLRIAALAGERIDGIRIERGTGLDLAAR